jgi:hypothetical protein
MPALGWTNFDGGYHKRGRQRPSIPIATLSNDDEKLRRFLDVMDWCIGELRSG